MIRDLLPDTHELLRAPTERFNFDNPQMDPTQLAVDLAETMINSKGIGLAANQIGLPYRVFALNGDPVNVIFNPRIVDSSPEQVYMAEGCLSYPGLFVKIKRPASVKIRYQLPNGETTTKEFRGLTARCIQHEIDHLDGVVFLKRANRVHLDQARKRSKKFYRAI